MKECSYCNREIETIPFHCRYCEKTFCSRHRLPENHDCSYSLLSDSSEKFLYSDISELLEKDLTVADIYHNYTIEKFTKEQTIELLSHILHESDETETRIHCIEAFGALELNTQAVFDLLEEIIISERNEQVKKVALEVIKELFPKKSKKVQKWLAKDK